MANDLIQRKYYIVDTEDSLPSEIVDGSIYYVKSNNALYIDMSSTRRRINPDYSNKLDANQGYINAGKSLSIDDNGNIIPVENINIDPTLKNQGQAADAKITGQALGELYDYFEGLQQIIENLDDSTAVSTDTTLSNQGVPADAKATGDRLASMQSELNVLEPTATASDVGKTLKVKTVANGKVSKYELGDMMIDNTLTQTGWAADAKKVGSELSSVRDEVRNESQARTTADNALREDINDDLAQIQAQISSVYGAPSTASTVAQMTDHTKAYVYTGEESGYVTGNWYYWNGSSWVSGGIYNAVAIQTDKSLTLDGKAADAKTVGDELNDLKDDLTQISEVVGFGTIETYDYVPIALDIDSRTGTQADVMFTQNADGSVYVTGTNTSNSENVYSIKNASGRTLVSLVAGKKYLLSGCPSGGSASTYRLGLKLDSGVNFVCIDTGNGVIANITESGNYRICISVAPGATVYHTFKPVIAEQVVTGQITDDILSAKDTVARESLSEDYVEDAGYIYNLGDYFRTDNGFINIDGTNSLSGHYYKTRAIRNITDELKHINTRINKHWNENNYILSNFVNDIETINILDLELVEDEYWDNGGIKSYTNEAEKYYRVKNLIDVTPEEIIVLINFGHAQNGNPNMTICGCYDENGNDLPGAVRFSSEYVIDYDIDGGSLHYVVFRIPNGCYKLGLHFKSFINNQSEFEPFLFYPRMVRKNKEESLADYSLMLNTAFIVAGTVNYEPELHRITFNNVYFGPLESNDSFAYGHYNKYQGNSQVVDWSDSLEENLRFAKHILFNSETRTLHWYDRVNDEPDGLTEQIANDRKHWFLVCICYKNYVDIPTGFTDAVINVNGVNINHIKNQYSLTDAMYLKGLSKKNLGKVPAILCAGQSNAVGVTPKTQLPSYVTFPIQNVGICKAGSDTFAPLTYENYTSTNNKWGFDLIAYHYISANGNTFNVIKHAMGATSIDTSGDSLYHWTPNYEELDTIEHSLLYTLESLTRACVENNNIDIKAIIWHQGEGDDGARFPTAAKNYYKNFLSMIAYMRGFVGNPYLPFICGTVSQKSSQYDASVDAAIRRAAQDDPNIYLVDMKNATLLDSYHFSSKWCEYFGKKVHDYLIDAKVFSGTKLNPSEPT